MNNGEGSLTAKAAVTKFNYDALGKLEQKELGEKITRYGSFFILGPTATEDYTYNIQGWLTNQTATLATQSTPLFRSKLYYYDGGDSFTDINNIPWAPTTPIPPTPSYTGNITYWQWQHETSLEPSVYGFNYDRLGRLTDAITYRAPQGWDSASLHHALVYDEYGITYDRNGNIQDLRRFDPSGGVDILAYYYTGNQLSMLDHNNTNVGVAMFGLYGYDYDGNGNMIFDERTNLFLQYNYLNLLEQADVAAMEFDPNDPNAREIANYTWLADGTKAQVIDQDDNGYVYLGSLIYKQLPDSTLELESTGHGSGRIVVKTNANGDPVLDSNGHPTYENQYHITDHLGSVRTVFNQTGEVLARNDFYPFGKPHYNPTLTTGLTNPANPESNRFLFNGKEKQLTGNLGLMDYGARMYDGEIGRWFNPDPMSEARNWLSPYNFVQNNPLTMVDPNGMLDELIIKGDAADAALTELQKSTNLELSMDDSGKVSAKQTLNYVTDNDKELLAVINDSSVTVNVTATESQTNAQGGIIPGGSFMGNTVTTNTDGSTSVTAEQTVIPGVVSALSNAYGVPGTDMLHEVTEAYQGALISQASGVSSPQAGIQGSVAGQAHSQATPQSGPMLRVLYDSNGKTTTNIYKTTKAVYYAMPGIWNRPGVPVMTVGQ